MSNPKLISLLLFFMVLMRPLIAFSTSVDRITFEAGDEAFSTAPPVVFINFFDIPTRKVERIILGSVVIGPSSDITFTQDSKKAFLPLYDSVAIIDIISKRVHKVVSKAVFLASDKDIIKTPDCSRSLLLSNQSVDNSETPSSEIGKVAFGSVVDHDSDITFTPDCGKAILPIDNAIVVIDTASKRGDKIAVEDTKVAPGVKITVTPDGSKALFLTPANASIAIVGIVSKKVEVVDLGNVVLKSSVKIFITPDGDTAIFLSYGYGSDNLVYGYSTPDNAGAGSGCIIGCGNLSVPVVGPMGNVTWNNFGNSGADPFSDSPYVVGPVSNDDTDQPNFGVPDGSGDNPTDDSGDDGYYSPPDYGDTVTPIPEPGTLLLLGLGLIGLAGIKRRLKAKS